MIFIRSLVSIIIPAYNAEQTIQRSITSCLNQSYKDIEVIIIDNHSTDKTADIIMSNKDSRVCYIYSEKKGRSLARNIGLKKAEGSYVQFLDADDELTASKIETAVTYLEQHLDYKGYVTGVQYIKNEKEVAKVLPRLHYPNELLAHNLFPIHSVLFRNDKNVTFDEEIDYCEDWLFWVYALHGHPLFFDETIGAIVHIHEGNTMGQKDRMNEYQLYVQQKIKAMYPIKSKQLLLNELKLFVIHYFTQEKEKATVDIIAENSPTRYAVISVLLKLPFLKQLAQKKAQNLAKRNLY
ncbi:glycosyltransferase [Vagococcus sp. BWB3-3]|uniref:Glycosyltransferase n=1 Tax=Vagococcus allomyrinae TaxID=2794353 RepID=A0A940PF28_9ENTE|nr:glycosyltransferase [Vagococcus allomyrinae]